jgi:hypothetical protein
MLCCWKSAKQAPVPIPFGLSSGVLPGRLPDTTTIALIARTAKRGARARVWLATACFLLHRAAFRPKDKSLVFSTLAVALGVPFLMPEDNRRPGGHHDRHAQLRNAGLYHTFCRGCRRDVRLVAAAGDVRLDAAGDGPARECEDAIGAGLCARGLSRATRRTGRGKPPPNRNLASRRSWSFFRERVVARREPEIQRAGFPARR